MENFSNTNKKVSSETILSENNITSEIEINKLSEPQQSFLFTSEKLKAKDKVTKFRFPSLELLEKNNFKLSSSDLNKNR